MNILFAASEAVPFVATGGLADVAGSLPLALSALDESIDCRVVIPLYCHMASGMKDRIRKVCEFNVPLAWRNQYCGLYEAHVGRVTYYLLDNRYYFDRGTCYGCYDDGERFSFFSKALLEMLQHIDFRPDVLHCNDWQTAAAIPFLNLFYRQIPKYSNIRTVFTIHNIAFQGRYGMEMADNVLGIPDHAKCIMEYNGDLNLMKSAIVSCDRVTTVSPTYSWEILDPWYSFGLDPLLRDCQYKLTGILNGIDTNSYNPQTDTALYANYSARNLLNKAKNKAEVQKRMGLEHKPDTMLVGMVSRLTSQKGLDLVKYAMEEMLADGVQVVIVGSGDYLYEDYFTRMQSAHPGQVAIKVGFLPELARKIYAASDVFLMPSKTEPCGLAQMVALRYGSLPIVRETGGLKDTIRDMGGENGNGYTFQTYNAMDMLDAVRRAHRDYNRPGWKKNVARAMSEDLSWARSAKEYLKMYQSL